jgi:hypothetical protein
MVVSNAEAIMRNLPWLYTATRHVGPTGVESPRLYEKDCAGFTSSQGPSRVHISPLSRLFSLVSGLQYSICMDVKVVRTTSRVRVSALDRGSGN